jgi:uncharacterized protein (DUF486 family)
MRTIFLENNKKHTFLIYMGIAVILYSLAVMANDGWQLPKNAHQNLSMIELITFTIPICCAITTGIVAYRLNRPIVTWAFMTLIFAPICLIILGNKKIKLKPEYKKILIQYESDYLVKKNSLLTEFEMKKIDYATFKEKRSKLLVDFNCSLNLAFQQRESYEENLEEEKRQRRDKREEEVAANMRKLAEDEDRRALMF